MPVKTSANKLRNRRRENPNPRAPAKDRDPWERQPDEAERAWAGFQAFRDAPFSGQHRFVSAIVKATGISRTQVDRWMKQWSWAERALAFDHYNDKVMISSRRKALLDMTAKHAAVAAGGIAALQRPLAEMIDRINKGTLNLKELTNKELTKLVVTLSPILKDFVGIERLARGVAGSADVYAMVDSLIGGSKPGGKTMAEIAEEMLTELEKKQAGVATTFNDDDDDTVDVVAPPVLIAKGYA